MRNDEVIQSEEIDHPGGLISMDLNVILPFYSEYGEKNEYKILHNGGDFRNYKFNCNCSGAKYFWESKISATGICGEDVNNTTKSPHAQYTAGLRLYGTYACSDPGWICRSTEYKDSPFYRVQAKTIQLLSINKLIGHILTSSNINRYTGLNRESLYGKAKKNQKDIIERLTWLSANIPSGINLCIKCKDASKYRVATILV